MLLPKTHLVWAVMNISQAAANDLLLYLLCSRVVFPPDEAPGLERNIIPAKEAASLSVCSVQSQARLRRVQTSC